MGSSTYSIIMMFVLLAILYFFMIRPENKRRKKAEELQNGLKKGDKITTIGGIVGTIVQVNDGTIVIETSDDRVRMEITKWGVSSTGVQTTAVPEPEKKKKAPKSDEEEMTDAPSSLEEPKE